MPSHRYDIRRLDQMKALVSPVRSKILRAFVICGPSSVREIAAFIGREPEAIYYHVRGLVAVDLVRLRCKRSIGPRSEAVYEAVSRSFHVARATRSKAFLGMMHKALRSCLRLVERQFESALADKTFREGARSRELSFHQADLRLSAADLREFLRRHDDALSFAAERHDASRGRWVTITTIITPGHQTSG